MTAKPIGSTGLAVGSICFGTSALGDMPETYGYGIGEAEARRTIHAIFDGPFPFMDTSRNYGDGRSEARIGAVIRERGGLSEGLCHTNQCRTGRRRGSQQNASTDLRPPSLSA